MWVFSSVPVDRVADHAKQFHERGLKTKYDTQLQLVFSASNIWHFQILVLTDNWL